MHNCNTKRIELIKPSHNIIFVLRWKCLSICEYGSRDEWWGCSLLCRATPGEMVTDNNVTVEGLTGGTSYDFRVAAVNEIGHGEFAQTKEPCTPPSSFTYIPLTIFVKKRTHESCQILLSRW